MNQFDLTASPMSEIFLDNPPAANFLPWTHVPNGIPLNQGVTQTPAQPIPAPKASAALKPGPATLVQAKTATVSASVVRALYIPGAAPAVQTQTVAALSPAQQTLRTGWMKKKTEIFAGKQHVPDSEDPETVNHLDWYESTNFKVPYPGEAKVRPANEFKKNASMKADNDD
jgi:hypothetical protein